MKAWVMAVIAALALAGCSAKGSIETTGHAVPHIDSRDSAAVIVTSSVPDKEDVIAEVRGIVQQRLLARRVFNNVQSTAQGARFAVYLNITNVSEVSRTGRILFGALAGQAELTVNVKIVDQKTNTNVGEMKATGTSSGGHIFAGTTDEAVEQVADQITDYLLQNRQL